MAVALIFFLGEQPDTSQSHLICERGCYLHILYRYGCNIYICTVYHFIITLIFIVIIIMIIIIIISLNCHCHYMGFNPLQRSIHSIMNM